MSAVLGVDVGGSGIKAAPVDLADGRLLAERHRIKTPRPATREAMAQALVEVVTHFEWQGPIGVGFPGVITDQRIRTAANLDPGLVGWSPAETLVPQLGGSVALVNDADAAALGELQYGGGAGEHGTVLVVTVGTGLGTALFRQGVLVPNTELGHLYFRVGKGRYKKAEKHAADSVRRRKELTWEEWAERFNHVLHEYCRLLWPDLILLGGGVVGKAEKFLPLLNCGCPIALARLGKNAGLIGAAWAGRPPAP